MDSEDADNWQQLGAVMRGIVERMEVIDRPPLPAEDARAFVAMLIEFEPARVLRTRPDARCPECLAGMARGDGL